MAVPATPVQDSEASTVTGLSTQPAAAAASEPRQRGETAQQRRERKQGIKMAQVSCQDTCIQQTSFDHHQWRLYSICRQSEPAGDVFDASCHFQQIITFGQADSLQLGVCRGRRGRPKRA